MAIITDLGGNAPKKQITEDATPKITAEKITSDVISHRTATLVDSDTPLKNMVNLLSGKRWTVEYYNQIKAEDDIVAPFDQSLPDSLSSYTLFDNFTLYVDSALESNTLDVEGSAKVNNITPEPGDIFRATVAGNRAALMRVETVKKASYDLSNIFVITYKLDTYLDKDDTRYIRLRAKVVKEFIEDNDSSEFGNGRILLKNEYKEKLNYRDEIDNIIDEFLSVALDSDRMILTVPNTSSLTVDPFHTKFFFDVVNYDAHPLIMDINHIGMLPQNFMTIYDAILDRDINLFKRKLGDTGYASVTAYNTYLTSKAPSTVGIKNILFPDKGLTERYLDGISATREPVSATRVYSRAYHSNVVNVFQQWRNIVHNQFQTTLPGYGTTVYAGSVPGTPTTPPPAPPTAPVTPPANTSTSPVQSAEPGKKLVIDRLPKLSSSEYLFPKDMLTKDEKDLSSLERLVLDYLNSRILDTKYLEDMTESYHDWDKVTKYWYLPILLVLVSYHISNINTIEHYAVNKY